MEPNPHTYIVCNDRAGTPDRQLVASFGLDCSPQTRQAPRKLVPLLLPATMSLVKVTSLRQRIGPKTSRCRLAFTCDLAKPYSSGPLWSLTRLPLHRARV